MYCTGSCGRQLICRRLLSSRTTIHLIISHGGQLESLLPPHPSRPGGAYPVTKLGNNIGTRGGVDLLLILLLRLCTTTWILFVVLNDELPTGIPVLDFERQRPFGVSYCSIRTTSLGSSLGLHCRRYPKYEHCLRPGLLYPPSHGCSYVGCRLLSLM